MDILTPHSPLNLEQVVQTTLELPSSLDLELDFPFEHNDVQESLHDLLDIDSLMGFDQDINLENFCDTLQKEEKLQTETQAEVPNKPLPKKRGRKPKIKVDQPRPRKTKVYELGPLEDKESERRRRNALTAKLHRTKEKNKMHEIEDKMKQMIEEVESLKEMLNKLQNSTALMQKRLEEQKYNAGVLHKITCED